jgi:dihydroxyacetone kinase-like protein
MQTPKKILNDPKEVVPELIDGLVNAYHDKIKKLESAGALVKTSLSEKKVGLLIGGGSGHEPLFGGFIGENMAYGAACGQIFAAPSLDIILQTTRALDQGNGVLYLYGNYAGDNMNFVWPPKWRLKQVSQPKRCGSGMMWRPQRMKTCRIDAGLPVIFW